MRSLIASLLVLAAVTANAQPFGPAMDPFVSVDPVVATPLCTGANQSKNTVADLYSTTLPDGRVVTAAWCPGLDGGSQGWIRIHPAGSLAITAPVPWLTDTAPRPPLPAYQVWALPGTTRAAYSAAYDPTAGTWLRGTPNGQAAQGGSSCACNMVLVKYKGYTYCPFGAQPLINSVTMCKATP